MRSVELAYVFYAVSSVLPKICTMNQEGCSTSVLGFVSTAKHMQQTSYARKCGVNGAPLYNVDVARVEFLGGTCVRRATACSLRRTRNDKIAAGLPVGQQSHCGLRRGTSTL